MMRLSTLLQEALDEVEEIEISDGQFVFVMTKDGTKVTSGVVERVDPNRQLVVIRDGESGTTHQIEVDAARYDLWVQNGVRERPGVEPSVTHGDRPIMGPTTFVYRAS